MLNSIEINPIKTPQIDWSKFNLPQRNYEFFRLTPIARAVELYVSSFGVKPVANEITGKLQLEHFLSLQ